MEELKEKASRLEIVLKSRSSPRNIEELLEKEQMTRDYLEVKKKLACIQYY